MDVNRTAAILLRQYYLMRGNLSRLLSPVVWVTIDILLWGFITKYLNTVASSGFNFVPALLGAVLLWDFFSRVMYGVTMAFFEDVWSRNFLNIFASIGRRFPLPFGGGSSVCPSLTGNRAGYEQEKCYPRRFREGFGTGSPSPTAVGKDRELHRPA
jgi:hypothetical protein